MATSEPGDTKSQPANARMSVNADRSKVLPRTFKEQARKHDERVAREEAHSSQTGRDDVEQASICPFPASDPPAHRGTRGITMD